MLKYFGKILIYYIFLIVQDIYKHNILKCLNCLFRTNFNNINFYDLLLFLKLYLLIS